MRTVLFGLDGATSVVLDHLMSAGVMPHLSSVCAGGVRSQLRSTSWPITPAAWTSLATGRSPGNHGFSDFIRLEFGSQGPMLRFNTSIDNHCEPIWHYASRNGKSATVLNYIGLAPSQPLDGHTIPGFVPGRHLKKASYPSDLFERLQQIEGLNVDTLGLDLALEREGLREMPPDQWLPWIDHHITREAAWFDVLQYLMHHEPSDLTMIVFDGVDKLQHLAYRYLDPRLIPSAPTPWESQVINRCHDYFAQIDKFLGRTIECVGDQARVFIASDHGFTETTEVFYVNKWLHDNGYLAWKSSTDHDNHEGFVVDRLTRHLDAYDWQRTTAFALTPSSNGVYIMNVEPEQYETFRDELIEGLLQIKGPDGGHIVAEVMKREEWFPGPYMKHAPDITLTLRDHGFFSVLNSRDTVIRRAQPAGTHHPEGILLGIGAGLRRGLELPHTLSILDVTPMLAHSLQLQIPSDYEGHFPAECYEEEFLRSAPPWVGSRGAVDAARSAKDDSSSPADVGMDAEDEAILVERLRSLGYLE